MDKQQSSKRWEDMSYGERIMNIPAMIKAGGRNLKESASSAIEPIKGTINAIDDRLDFNDSTGLTWNTPDKTEANRNARLSQEAAIAAIPPTRTVEAQPLTATEQSALTVAQQPTPRPTTLIQFDQQPTIQPAAVAYQPTLPPTSGGLITKGGQTFSSSTTGNVAVSQDQAAAISQGFDQAYGPRPNGSLSITDGNGNAVGVNRNRYSEELRSPEMQANIDAGRPPNVHAGMVNIARDEAAGRAAIASDARFIEQNAMSREDALALSGGNEARADAFQANQRIELQSKLADSKERDRLAKQSQQARQFEADQIAINESQALGVYSDDPATARRNVQEYEEARAYNSKYGERVARAESQLGRPLKDPSELFTFELQQDQTLMDQGEKDYAAATNDLMRIRQSDIETSIATQLEGNPDLLKKVNEDIENTPEGYSISYREALEDIIAGEPELSESAAAIIEMSESTWQPSEQYLALQYHQDAMLKGLMRNAQRTGIPTTAGYEPYSPALTQADINRSAQAAIYSEVPAQ